MCSTLSDNYHTGRCVSSVCRAAPTQTNDASLGPTHTAHQPRERTRKWCLAVSQSPTFCPSSQLRFAKMTSRSPLVPIGARSRLANCACKNNQWWTYLNEKVVKTVANDCFHLRNKFAVTILRFLHLAPFSLILSRSWSLLGSRWKSQSGPLSEWASEARGWQGFKDWLVIASICFPPEWFWNWQFQILSLDKSSDCSGIAKVEAHIGRNAICPGYVTFYRNSLFAAEICQNESIFSHITTWATFRDKYSWWLERVGGLAGSLGQKLPAPVMNYSIVGMERED